MLKIVKIEFTEIELDWIDQGHGICSDLEEPWGNDLVDKLILKLREVWNNKDFQTDNNYIINLNEEEIEFIYTSMFEFMFEDYGDDIYHNQEIIGNKENRIWTDFKETLELTNSILQKLGKPILTLEYLKTNF